MNGRRGFLKANQGRLFPYTDTHLTVAAGAIIEKTFYLQAYPVARKGSGFRVPLRETLDIYHPFSTDGLPTLAAILDAKYRFTLSRWHEGPHSAGFRMYPDRNEYVMGWAGQAGVPGYALLVLAQRLNAPNAVAMAQRALDHLATAPINRHGFPVRYNPDQNKWYGPDPVSQGQAMETFARAILAGRKMESVDTSKWETFLRKACDVHAARILDDAWGCFQAFLAVGEMTKDPKHLKWAEHAMDVTLTYTVVWDIDMPPGRLRDHGVLYTPEVYRMGEYLKRDELKKLAVVMYRTCGQMLDPDGSQGEQLNHTNFVQGMNHIQDVHKMRGTYREDWTVYWMTAHFLNAAAQFEEMGVSLDQRPDRCRSRWHNLNGVWEFVFDEENQGLGQNWRNKQTLGEQRIVVPFAPESVLGGVHDESFHRFCWSASMTIRPRRSPEASKAPTSNRSVASTCA